MKSETLLHSHHNNADEPATKLHWPDDSRQSEPGILNAVHEVAQRKPQVDGWHAPEMIWLHQVEETSAAKLRRGLEIGDPERCSRILNIHVSWKLQPITNLSEKEFKRAWWLVVICHRILWVSDVRHYDVSLSNHMAYRTPDGLVMGIINDCDLSSSQNGTSGHERTAMVPFMAVDLVTKEAIEGNVEPLYQHVAESFIWVFVWVILQYEDGKLLSKNRPLDYMLTIDAVDCQEFKCGFLKLAMENRIPVSPPHSPFWSSEPSFELAYLTKIAPYMEGSCLFRTWFTAQLPSLMRSLVQSLARTK